jgi:hypothetical protein
MTQFADLEIELRPAGEREYQVQYRYRPPDSAAEARPGGGVATIDVGALDQLVLEPERYGQTLTDSLFAQPGVRTPFDAARASAESLQVPLRIRLLIDPRAAELQRVRWETLRDPRNGSFLCANENVYLSRFALTGDYQPVRLPLKSKLQSLLVVANPTDLSEYPHLAPIDTQKELAVARQGLGEITSSMIPEEGLEQRASLEHMLDQLRENKYDILYLVCHGQIDKKGDPWLWLEDADGKAARVAGAEFVQAIGNLADCRPSLIVLASCQSAGDGTGQAMTALGPVLAVAGVPAVIAMQGSVSMDTATTFMSTFFEELNKHGIIDRATAMARAKVQKQPDFWMPVLFMRLERGSIWSGFTESAAFNKWPALCSLIEDKQLTPILGSGLFEPLLGSMREIARNWAKAYQYPMFPHEQNSLPQITQYLAIEQFEGFPKSELEKHLRKEIQEKHRADLPAELLLRSASVDRLVNEIGAKRRQRVAWDVYRVLAELDLPVYITANLNQLLESALEEMGKKPRTIISPWNDYVLNSEPRYNSPTTVDDPPTPESPLVYHLFGRLDQPDSVVLTEDDFFQYLIGVTRNIELVPMSVQEAMTNRALLFLGFHLEDWDFRVLFQSLLSFEGGALRKSRRKNFVNIAVQLEPEGLANPETARRYLESYFVKEDIFLYWGSAEDFIKELMYYLPSREKQ